VANSPLLAFESAFGNRKNKEVIETEIAVNHDAVWGIAHAAFRLI
jgi:hypothetical protein